MELQAWAERARRMEESDASPSGGKANGSKKLSVPGAGAASIVPADKVTIRDLIYTVRGMQVMLDSDLARLYGVETGNLNKAAGRNAARFPEEFRFKLTSEEWDVLLFQNGRAKSEKRGGRRTPPFAYTEQGVAMLSAVLRSDTAVRVSVQIMNAFVEMRHFIASNASMFEQIRSVELRQLEYQREVREFQQETDERFERVFDYMETREAPAQKVFFEGQVWDAFELLVSLVQRAKREIVLVDGYVDAGTLNIPAKKREGVDVTIWTYPRSRLTKKDVDTFNAQYPRLEVRHTDAFHDRFLILDGAECYLVGASLKDAGKKAFAVARIEDTESVAAILARPGKR